MAEKTLKETSHRCRLPDRVGRPRGRQYCRYVRENVVLLKTKHRNKLAPWPLGLSLLLGWAIQWYSPMLQAEGLLEASDAFDRGEFVTALELYDVLAQDGDARAQYRLGMMYEQGLGTDPDTKIAANWYAQAAEQESPEGLAALSALHLKGAGVIQNFKESIRLNQQAAALGYAPAQYGLGVAYANGVGTFRDPVKAHMWFNIASASGYPNAMQSRERIASSMGEAAVARAQDKAKTCIDRDFSNC